MRSITSILGLCFMYLVLTPFIAFGQESTYKAELYGGIGYGKFYDDEGSLGRGPIYRAGVGVRVASRLALRAEALGIHHTRGDYFHVTGNSLFVFGNAVYFFPRSRVQPYLLAGIGGHRADYRYSWPGTSNGEYRISKSGLAVDFGAGVKLFLSPRWSLDPELRIACSRSYYSLFNYLSANLAYHW